MTRVVRGFSGAGVVRGFSRALPLVIAIVTVGAEGVTLPVDYGARLARYEATLRANPEDLKTGAEYRQLIIRGGHYDRAIGLFEGLASRSGAGPDVALSLALAYVDKVPGAGAIRKLYLGRDAMGALTKSIARRPSPVAYYVRGLINLYYNNMVFKRTERGISDLREALRLREGEPWRPYYARVFVSLGDGYWRFHDEEQARRTWADGLSHFPTNADLQARTTRPHDEVHNLVERSLDPNVRVDTSLRELFPDIQVD